MSFFGGRGRRKFLLGSQHDPLEKRQAVVGGAYLPSHFPANGVHAQASPLQPARILIKKSEGARSNPPGKGVEGVNRR